MTEAAYRAAKANMTDWRQKPTKAAAQFDRKKLDQAIAEFDASGLKSAFSQNRSSTSAPPTPAKTPDGSPSALSLSDEEYKRIKRDISYDKIPALNASDFVPV
jgi:hypothetical protein